MRSVLRAIALAGIFGMLSACGGTSSPPVASGCAVKLGFFGALTGQYANLGQNILDGVKLAITEYNASGPRCAVSLVEFDSQADPAAAPALAKKAIDTQDLLGLIGPAFSGEAKAAGPALDEAGLPWITTATNPALATNGWRTFHRILGNDATQGPAAAAYLRGELGAQRVFLIDDGSEYGRGLTDLVRRDLGAAVVGSDVVQPGQTDFTATITKIRGADAVYYGGYYAEAGLLVRAMRTAGLRSLFVGADGAKDEGFVAAAGTKAAEGAILTCPCLPAQEAGGFAERYRAAFATEPGTFSAECFDATTAFLAGITAGNTSRDKLTTFLSTYRAPGVSKTLGWDAQGEPRDRVVWAYRVTDGRIVPVKRLSQ
ncbi:MAG: branched-chain amino acid ABC transporter substrate-binding protein [Angustibacter sp.]